MNGKGYPMRQKKEEGGERKRAFLISGNQTEKQSLMVLYSVVRTSTGTLQKL